MLFNTGHLHRLLPNNSKSDERGAAMLEAPAVVMVLIPVIVLAVYFFILTLRLTSAHYEIQNALREVSTGPRDGNDNLASRFRDTVEPRLRLQGLNVSAGNLTVNGAFESRGFVSVEFIVDIFPDNDSARNLFGILIPRPRVITGMRMQKF